MPSTTIQYVFKPNPGADLEVVMGYIKQAARFWREHGAEASLWSVQVGEIGNMVFAIRCESAAKLGAAIEGVNNDPGFAQWRAATVKAGLTTWVRSNQAYEITI
jgi:hypothetical protein